ncbi:MAG: LytTR family transcriptional regulator DNA-binding domain-containing protein [Lachnospiraceae bacterium]|nr:LytTR family transcriptional regulator DNA-binding domain-containing protein [Lachnospiraceae bacterium]
MLIRTEINDRYKELELHVCNEVMNERVQEVVHELHSIYDEMIYGTDEKGDRHALSIAGVISFYAEGQRVIALNREGKFNISKKLYELEESLSDTAFVRISKSEIINTGLIVKLDLNMAGTIRITMKNGYSTFASRRNVAKLRKILVNGRSSSRVED